MLVPVLSVVSLEREESNRIESSMVPVHESVALSFASRQANVETRETVYSSFPATVPVPGRDNVQAKSDFFNT